MKYYNEIEPFACEWLTNLCERGEIYNGDIDRRSIEDVASTDVVRYRQCHFFAGIGGWPLALKLAGWPGDITTWTGSCPCQPYSVAGKNKGNDDERNLWPDFFRLIRECRPEFVFGEQVPNAIGHGWLDGISADLEKEGYTVGSCVLGAHSVGSPHKRQRLYWVAIASGAECGWRSKSTRQHGRALHVTNGGADGVAQSGCERRKINGIPLHSQNETEVANKSQPIVSVGDSRQSSPRRVPGQGCLVETLAIGIEIVEPKKTSELAGSSMWGNCELIHFIDGKTRRIERGVQPVAYGIPRSMGRGEPELRRVVKRARSNRVGRLKGYGNAIVPQVASVFVLAVMNELGLTAR